MKKPVIAQIVQYLAPGGIEAMVLDLKTQSSNSDNVHIISLQGSINELLNQWSRLAGLDKLHVLEKPEGVHVPSIFKLARLLKKNNIDVIHTHHVGPLLYGGFAAKLAGCKHVHTEHDAWHLSNAKRRFLVKMLFSLLKPTIVADAHLVKDNILKNIPNCNINVIMNGVNVDQFTTLDAIKARKKLNLPCDAPIIGCAARLTEVKGHHILLQAFSKLSRHIHLALAGDGELLSQLQKQATELKIVDRVHFLGTVTHMPTFYNAIDVFCLASFKEGLPLSPLEAQACQRNVVLTDVGGCQEAISPEVGLLVSSNDVEALANALEKQLTTGCDQDSRSLARSFIVQNRNLEQMLGQYQALYL